MTNMSKGAKENVLNVARKVIGILTDFDMEATDYENRLLVC